MPETVDDFMRRFGGGGTVDDEDAVRFHERFISTRPEDRHFDNRAYHDATTEYLGKLPDDQFREAARSAVAQAPPQEKAGILGAILSAMSGSTRWNEPSCRRRWTRRNREHARSRFH